MFLIHVVFHFRKQFNSQEAILTFINFTGGEVCVYIHAIPIHALPIQVHGKMCAYIFGISCFVLTQTTFKFISVTFSMIHFNGQFIKKKNVRVFLILLWYAKLINHHSQSSKIDFFLVENSKKMKFLTDDTHNINKPTIILLKIYMLIFLN